MHRAHWAQFMTEDKNLTFWLLDDGGCAPVSIPTGAKYKYRSITF